jgi:hypothetical protein
MLSDGKVSLHVQIFTKDFEHPSFKMLTSILHPLLNRRYGDFQKGGDFLLRRPIDIEQSRHLPFMVRQQADGGQYVILHFLLVRPI